MTCDPERLRVAQAVIRRAAMGFSVEEAMNALAAVSAEAIVSAAPSSDRPKLLRIFDQMVRDFVRGAEERGSSLII
jgi:hypothetical protein